MRLDRIFQHDGVSLVIFAEGQETAMLFGQDPTHGKICMRQAYR